MMRLNLTLYLFNRALLGKWLWRWRTDANSFWCQVVRSKYVSACPKYSAWWRDIDAVCQLNELNWFDGAVSQSIKSGDATDFWHDECIGDKCLRGTFYRLYNLSRQKWHRVSDCCSWEHERWQWKFLWRRPLVGWEQAMLNVIGRVQLFEGVPDAWLWLPSNDDIYSVNSAYLFLQEPTLFESDQDFLNIWQSLAPSNVNEFA